ncbi:DNA primase [Reichenbachiella sp. MALMAid0571]|uniref:DNA primase n=1 Tax=Reichenbachiella sp. MALMAid0571 TaxID=3143939 RepID=UPI0032DF597A
MINQATIDEIKSRMDIYEVVNDFVRLKKSGSSYKALSPFTNEKTPSFVVSPSKGIYKCFSSGKGGDSISFLQEVDGLSYIEALKYLAQKYGITIEEDEMPDNFIEEQNLRESLFIILNFAKDYYKNNLHNSDEGKSIGLSYFKERGFSEETIDKFDLGYAFDQWDGLIKSAKENGHNQDFLEQAGLKIVKEEKQYDRFRSRVIFPIHNITGKVIAFGARILKNDKNQPKYINSPETDLYHKSNILYGIFQAKNTIRNEDNCYLVEGYTDVISLHQAGIHNVVASSGTSLTDDQIKLIKRFSDNITVLFDGDKAGLKASMRGIDMILEGGLNVKAVPFPEGEDPDSYSKSLGPEGFKQYLDDNAKDFIAFKASVFIAEGKNDPIKKAESIREIVQSISLIPDPIKRSVYLQECSNLLNIEETVLINELNKLLINKRRDVVKKEERAELVPEAFIQEKDEKTDRSDAIYKQERESIRILLNYGMELIRGSEEQELHLIEYFISESEDLEFETPVYKRIFDLFKEKLIDGVIIDANYLLDSVETELKSVAVDLMTERYELSPQWKDKYKIIVPNEKDVLKNATYTNILRLKLRIVQKLSHENMDKLKASKDEKETNEILMVQRNLKKYEVSIAEILGIVVTSK